MTAWTGGAARRNTGAFTLIELLLTLALLLLLLGAAAFSFSSLRRGAELNEGASRLETLFRFARAHAAYSGCRVQLEFTIAATQEISSASTPSVRAFYEAEPMDKPGVWTELRGAEWNLDTFADLVTITGFQDLDDALTLIETEEVAEEPGPSAPSVARLSFFPDGSSDSAEILLASRDIEDRRQIAVRLTGLTGAITQREIHEDPVPLETSPGKEGVPPGVVAEAGP